MDLEERVSGLVNQKGGGKGCRAASGLEHQEQEPKGRADGLLSSGVGWPP